MFCRVFAFPCIVLGETLFEIFGVPGVVTGWVNDAFEDVSVEHLVSALVRYALGQSRRGRSCSGCLSMEHS